MAKSSRRNLLRQFWNRLQKHARRYPAGRRQPLLMEPLEDRRLLATVTWINPAGGNWNSPSNWRDDAGANRVPVAADDVVIAVTGGNYNVTLNVDASVNTFRLDSPNATFSATNRIFTVNGDSLLAEGNVVLDNSTWSGAGTLENEAAITIFHNVTISSGFEQNGNVVVQAFETCCPTAHHATLTVSAGFSNTGTMNLQSSSQVATATLAVTSGILQNMGIINAVAGTGGRIIAADLVNDGEINLLRSTTFSKADGVYTNNNEFTLGAGQTLTINGNQQAFHQNGGELINQGTISLTSVTFDVNGGVVSNLGALSMGGGTFQFDGGSTSGNPFSLDSSSLNIGPGSAGAAAFTFTHANTLTGDVAAAQTLTV